mgnify:CR=1 FL=1
MTPPRPPRQDRHVAVILDLVRSRDAQDRKALHERFAAALERVGGEVEAVQPLAVVVGDEAQGVYAGLGAAIDAAWRVRLELLPEHDVRAGIGVGGLEVLDETTNVQDGPAWWAAREALEAAESAAARPGSGGTRTAVRSAQDDPLVVAADVAVRCRDAMVGSLPDTARSVLGGLMRGERQQDIAARLGITQSAVSQRATKADADVLRSVAADLAGLP